MKVHLPIIAFSGVEKLEYCYERIVGRRTGALNFIGFPLLDFKFR